ncbi:Hly-III family protein [Roseivivax isoporae LMG 25204]|uniref:Hly-III family protein n=1 Tax=Roseivivax isoporae LMG 25204 TaxID=1449351 RepID=X7F904_9RHOB|nr:Hly-III family protein [Roseivivax isoporae LMG 25204]
MTAAPREYSRGERLSDAVVHLAGLVLALAAVPVLITLTAVWRGDAAGIAAVSIYGATLIAMLLCSLLYNHLRTPGWTPFLRRLDHSAIHFKIAGTYTPFALLSGAGGTLLAAIWVAAAAATLLVVLVRRRPTRTGVVVGLLMGWAVIVGGQDVIAALPWSVLGLMVVGGLLYSAGTPFLLAERLRYHNTIWHGFVVAASILFFVAVFLTAAAVPGTA